MRENELLPLLTARDRVGRLPPWLFAGLVFVLYVLAATSAWYLFRVGSIAAVWPAAAVALAACLYGGWWMAPVILLADASASVLNGLPVSPLVSLGNLAGPLLGAMLFRRLVSHSAVPQTLSDTVGLLLIVVPIVAAVTTVFGLVWVMHSDVLRGFSPGFLAAAWWLGDVLGLVAFTPLMMAAFACLGGLSVADRERTGAGRSERAVLVGLLLLLALLPWLPMTVNFLASADSGLGGQLVVQLLLLLFVLMIWSALRLSVIAVFGLVPLAVLTGLKLSLIELISNTEHGDHLQWLVLLPTLVVMAVVTLLIEVGTRERQVIQRRLTFQSEHDSLTGLLNRRAFERRVRRQLADSDRNTMWLLGYLDLDRFQVVNDTLGHTAGDELLVQLADRLAIAVAEDEWVARLGGDEFGLLVRGPWQSRGRESIENIQAVIGAFRFEHSGQVYALRASIGVTDLAGEPADFGRLLSVADAACFSAKEQGRDRVHYSHGRDRVRRHIDELQKVPLIQDALDHARVELYGQAIVGLAPGRSGERALEVLCRLRDAQGRLVETQAFIEVAERSGMMRQIDRRVLSLVLDWLERCERVPDRCFINLSAASIANAGFIDEIIDEIRRRRGDARGLVFEITETAAIGNYPAAHRLMERLRELEAAVALDDFGSGMSSFGHLQALPVDFVKIDARFVHRLGEGLMNESIVRSIAQISCDCGILSIAEGVEDAEALAILRRHGIDYAQGFHIGRPSPLEVVSAASSPPRTPSGRAR